MTIPLLTAYNFSLSAIADNLGALGRGLVITVEISAIGMFGSVLIGLLGAAASTLRVPVLRQVTYVYVELFRNTPLLVQVFFLYFALPLVGPTLSAFTVGWLALVLWGGAFSVENLRAGFGAVDRRYEEAARALGFSRTDAFRRVVLPIGLRISAPSMTNTLISVLKNSALMLGIGLLELTGTAVKIASEDFRVFEMFSVIAVIYLGLIFILAGALHALGRRYAIHGAS